MKFPKRHLWVFMFVLLGAGTARAQVLSEVFAFPQGHDTTFGQNLFLGPFFWFAQGDGARGDRISTNGIASVEAVGFTLFLGPSCVFNGQMVIELYVNDRKVGETPMPPAILCNSTPAAPVSASFNISNDPIAGTGVDRNVYEFRIQLRGTLLPIPDLFTFYKIDTSNSNIAIAGAPEPPPPPPPPPPLDPHPGIVDQIIFSEDAVVGQIVGSEGNINANVVAQGDRAVSAVDAVRAALGIVEGNVQASIAGAVLSVNSTVAAGIDTLPNVLGYLRSSLPPQSRAMQTRSIAFSRRSLTR